MQTIDTITETGCYLDSHRGHYILRDVVWLAEGFGYHVGPLEKFALDMYGKEPDDVEFPDEAMHDMADAAVQWLNSGQSTCPDCMDGDNAGLIWERSRITGEGALVICKSCSGKDRYPREPMQNFPPRIPDDHVWEFNDGDFGLSPIEED